MIHDAADRLCFPVAQYGPGVNAIESVQRLYGTPSIIQGEALSGWLYRVASHHRISINNLRRLLRLQHTQFNLDFGLRLSGHSITHLAAMTLNEPAGIMAAVLPALPLLSGRTFRCLTFNLAMMTPIYRVCVRCIKDDSIPYIRRSWRLAYSLVCDRHALPLIDCCPKCKHHFDFSQERSFKHTFMQRTMVVRHCPHCAFDLTCIASCDLETSLWMELVHFQAALHRIVALGFFKHPRFGTISAVKALENYLATELLENKHSSIVRFVGIDFSRCFGTPHGTKILEAISPAKGRRSRSRPAPSSRTN